MPPRATSNTAVSTFGFWSTIWADFGPDMSPFLMSRPSTTMPSVEVMPTRRPISLRMWAIIRTVVVLPFVPVTEMIGMRDGAAGREEPIDHGPRDVLRLALGRVGMHPEAGRRVDLDDRAAGLADGRRDVGADEVDAGDVEPDDLGGRLGDLDVVGMGLHRPVDRRPAGRHVAGQGELDPRAVGRDVIEAEALVADELLGCLVDLDPGQHLLVADATARVLVRDVDQLADGALAVAGHARRHALRDRRDLAADHQAAVVVAGDVGLDDDVARTALGEGAPGRRHGPAPRERRSRWTPRPWLPSSGLTTHGKPSRFATATASSSVVTTSARGTGRPALSSSRLVRLLSDAMSTPIALVFDVIVARIRCWWTPWPNCTSEWRSSRMNGMSRLTASSISAWVDGPNAWRSASRISRSSLLREVEEDAPGRRAPRGG